MVIVPSINNKQVNLINTIVAAVFKKVKSNDNKKRQETEKRQKKI